MKIVGLCLLLTIYVAFGNCRTFATSYDDNDVFNHLEDFLAFVEFLAKELEQAVIITVREIEDCFPIMVEQHRKGTFPRDYPSADDYSSEIGSCLWDKLKDLVGESFDTIRDIFKRILGIKKARAIQLNSGANTDQRTVDDQMHRALDPFYKLLQMDKDFNVEIAKRIEAVFKSVETSFQLMICFLKHEDTDHDQEQQ